MATSKFMSISVLLIVLSCSTKMNQYLKTDKNVQLRDGRWIEKERDPYGEYISKGRYIKGEKTGRWKTVYQGRKYHQEKFRKGYSVVKFYHPNGKLMETGRTETKILPQERIWQKTGNWKYYDDTGKLLLIKKYFDGQPIADSILQK